METVATFIAYIAIPSLIFSCYTVVHRLVSSQIIDIDLRNLKVVQLTNKRDDGNKVAIRKFLEHGPIKFQENVFSNGQVIAFYNSKFRLIKSLIEVLYFSTYIWGIIIFARISMYGIEVTSANITRSVFDFVIGGYFLLWLYFLHKMRCVATEVKLDYTRYIS